MKGRFHSIVALVLALVMCVSLLPTTFANEAETETIVGKVLSLNIDSSAFNIALDADEDGVFGSAGDKFAPGTDTTADKFIPAYATKPEKGAVYDAANEDWKVYLGQANYEEIANYDYLYTYDYASEANGNHPWHFTIGNQSMSTKTGKTSATGYVSKGGFYVEAGSYTNTFVKRVTDTPYMTLQTYIPTAGTYSLSAIAAIEAQGLDSTYLNFYITAVPEGGATITLADIQDKEEYKVGSGLLKDLDGTESLGEIYFKEAGEYYIVFELRDDAVVAGTSKINKNFRWWMQNISLTGIKDAEKNVLQSITLTSPVTELVKNKTAELSVTETWSVSGEKKSKFSDIKFTSSSDAIATVDENGVVKAVTPGKVTITAAHKEDETVVATVDIDILDTLPAAVQEFVTKLSVCNFEKMREAKGSENYKTEPVIRPNTGVFYAASYLNWDAVIPAKYSATNEDFKVMDLSKTSPWAYEAELVTVGPMMAYESNITFEMKTANYGVQDTPFIALRIKTERPGEYVLQGKAVSRTDAPAPAVYFFKDGIDGVESGKIDTYPADSKVGYFKIPTSDGYSPIGKISIPEEGEYILSFVGDKESLRINSTADSRGAQTMNLEGIKIVPAADDKISAISMKVDKAIAFENEFAQAAVSGTFSISGTYQIDPALVTFKVEDEEIASISESGKIVALKEGKTKITATYKADETLTAETEFTVIAEGTVKEHNFVLQLSAFNKEFMVENADFQKGPYLRPEHKIFYYTPAMHWDYEVPAEYSTTGEAFMAMNLDKTDKWAFESCMVHVGQTILYDNNITLEFKPDSYKTTTPSFIAFRLNVELPGSYNIIMDTFTDEELPNKTYHAAPAVYLFKDGTDNVINGSVSTYPAESKLGHLALSRVSGKTKFARVDIPSAGEYIISFVGDAGSLDLNANKDSRGVQEFRLKGITLEPAKPDIYQGIALTAENTEIYLNAEEQIDVSESWSETGLKEIDASLVTFKSLNENIATVDDNGIVKGVAEGTAEIKATLKSDPNQTATIEIKVRPDTGDSIVSIELILNDAEIYVTQKSFVTARVTWKYAGRADIEFSDIKLSSSDENVATVSEDGIIEAIAASETPVTITAVVKGTDPAVSDTAEIKVSPIPAPSEIEFKIGLNVFNSQYMITDHDYNNIPALRPNAGVFYYTPAMHWNYIIPAEYSSKGEPFRAMNLDRTEPWAFEAQQVHIGQGLMYEEYFKLEFSASTYLSDKPSMIAFRLKVDAPGEYILQSKAGNAADAPVPAVYFFKADQEGVDSQNPATYPAGSKLGYYDIPRLNARYATNGVVKIDEMGEYIVAYVGDKTSKEMNSLSASNGAQNFDLYGIKLIPLSEDVDTGEIAISAYKQLVMVDREMQIDVKRIFEIAGEVPTTDYSKYEFTSSNPEIATVDKNGIVRGVAPSENPIKITVTVKDSNPVISQSILFKVVPLSDQQTYTYKLTVDAFNYNQMESVTGINETTKTKFYYRDVSVEAAPGKAGVMFHNGALADPNLIIPEGYYGEGNPAEPFYAMDTTDEDGDPKGTDPWKFVGGKALDNEGTTLFQLRGVEADDGFHPYFDRSKYTDGPETQFVAFSLTVPVAGEYMLTIDSKRHGSSPAPAVYFFKDEAGSYADASFTKTAPKLGYYKANDTSKSGYEYVGKINCPEAGNYVVAFVMDANCKNIAPGAFSNHGITTAQYISLMGIKLVPLYEDNCVGISIDADTDLMYAGDSLQLTLNEVWEIVGEKEVFDFSSVILSSSDTSIATVDENGLVTGVSKGVATITAVKKNTYPEVTASFKVTVYDPDESILGVKLDYMINTTVMKDQTTYNPHNNRLDASGNLRDLTHVNDYKKINGEKTALWCFNNRASDTWRCLQKNYMSIAIKPVDFANNPFFVIKLRVPLKGEFYLNSVISTMAYGCKADVHFLPTSGIEAATLVHATEDNFVGTIDSTSAQTNQRLGLVKVAAPGDYYVIFRFHSGAAALDDEGRNFFALNSVHLAAPAGPYSKIGMYVDGVDANNTEIPFYTEREFRYALCDAAGVEVENFDPEAATINEIAMTKGKGTVADFVFENGKYFIKTTNVAGDIEITADITYNGTNVREVLVLSVANIGKTGRTIYTDDMIEAARENIKRYDWAKAEQKSAVKNAEPYIELGAEYIWNILPGQGIPRAYNVAFEIGHPKRDPYEMYCRYCNTNLLTEYSTYPWKVDSFTLPWKIVCPECSRMFPTNDFGSFYELGRTQKNQGKFDRKIALENHRAMLLEKMEKGEIEPNEAFINAEAPAKDVSPEWYLYYGYGIKGGYLHNDMYTDVAKPESGVRFATAEGFQNGDPAAYSVIVPETVERWGVDDGFGYHTGRQFTNGVWENHSYIPYFAHFGIWQFSGTAFAASALEKLGLAYLYTGDEKYGRLGAIILDRVADMYPDMNLIPYTNYPNSTGGSSDAGKDLGRIWGCFTAEIYAEAYDVFYPMFEDPEVIKFLSEKAKYYGMENDKSTAVKIRKNVEDGVCREVFEACKKSHIKGNFGLHQAALVKAAVALDDKKDTAEMLDWLFASENTDHHSYNTGGDISRKLVDGVYRDGMNTESPYYNQMGISDLMEPAVVLERYARAGGDTSHGAILEHPKYLKMINCFQTLTLLRRGLKGTGDAGYPLYYGQYPDTDPLILAFNYTKNDPDRFEENLKMAQHLYFTQGKKLKDRHYDIWTKNPESLYDEVVALVEEYGEYDYDKSSIMTGYGFGILRDGTYYDANVSEGLNDTTRSFMLNFSGHHQHNHHDMLDLQIDAFGLGMTYDFGYAEFMVSGDPHSTQLTSATIGHNTVVVDETNQVGADTGGIPQEPIHFDAKDTKVKVVDARTPIAYNQCDEYRRTVLMIEVDSETSYGVDFFRVLGGNDHLWTISPASDTRPEYSDNLKFVKQVDDPQPTWRYDHTNYYPYSSYAGPTVQFGEDPGTPQNKRIYPYGYTWMYDIERAEGDQIGDFWLDYAIPDMKKMSRNPNGHDYRLRMTMLNEDPVNELTLTSLLPQRIGSNFGIEHFEKVLVRRKGRNLDSLFTTVYEPYEEGKRQVTDITRLKVEAVAGTESRDDVARAVKVKVGENRTDYVVYATNKKVTYKITDEETGYSFDFRGFIGVWTIDAEGKNTYSYLHDGDILGEGEDKVEGRMAAITGKITAFQEELSLDNWIDVEFDTDVSVNVVNDLADRMIIPSRKDPGTSAYLIEGATMIDSRHARLDLGSTSTIDGLVDINDADAGYIYILEKGKKFEIPMSYEENGAPKFTEIPEQRSSVGSLYSVTIKATADEGSEIDKYMLKSYPSGASLDEKTGEINWKPSMTQSGKNLFVVEVVDTFGRVSSYSFEVNVLGGAGGGAGGGGGGAGAPSKPEDDKKEDEKPEEETKPEETKPEDDKKEDVTVPEIEDEGFVDLGNHAWAEESINELAEAGIIKGTSATTFAPASNITRADYALLLVRAFKLESDNTENFADVSENDYYAAELAIARNTKLVAGIGNNMYAPRKHISRQDMMLIMYRALVNMGIELKDSEIEAPDYDKISEYAKGAVSVLVANGLVNGKNGYIDPLANTTRAEVAVLINRILDFIAANK